MSVRQEFLDAWEGPEGREDRQELLIIKCELEAVWHLKLMAELVRHVSAPCALISPAFDKTDESCKEATDQRLKSKNRLDSLWNDMLGAIGAARNGNEHSAVEQVKQIIAECDLARSDLKEQLARRDAAGRVPLLRKAFGGDAEPK